MIASFRDGDTKALMAGTGVRRFRGIERQAITRLRRLEAAEDLADLAAIPGNRLEALAGQRRGQYSIRINVQWRICFRWTNGRAHDVEIVDYH